MIPGGMDPKKMQAMMRQMGIKSEELDASRVIIETSSGKLIVESPQVVQITMQGQVSFQIAGEVKRESFSDEDVKMVMEQAGCDEDAAKKALEAAGGDIAEAIVKLAEEKE